MSPYHRSRIVPLAEAEAFPVWRRPVALLIVMAAAMPLSFAVWVAALQNFVIEVAHFDGSDWGWLQTVREIPGLLSVGAIAVILFMRQQTLALVSLLLLGVAIGATAYLPSFGGLLLTTIVSSTGYHYFETMNQSLQLQWIDKARAPKVMGWLLAVTAGSSLLAYGLLVVTWKTFDLSYEFVFTAAGLATVAIAVFAWLWFPQFEAPNPQVKRFLMRRRYWLYYALQFMAGARRQIFVVFAAFMMVERFGFQVHEVTALLMTNFVISMVLSPAVGSAVLRWGERRALMVEYAGLTAVFLGYGGIYYFGWGVVFAAALYIIDHLFFAMKLALKTYFQKIADPGDIAPTQAVAFTINHIAAVFLPAVLGYVWLVSPGAVFGLAAAMAVTSLAMALLIPRHPEPGRETIFSRLVAAPAE